MIPFSALWVFPTSFGISLIIAFILSIERENKSEKRKKRNTKFERT